MQINLSNKDYLNELLGKGIREGNRGVSDYREIVIEVNKIPHAEGSAMVDIGNTKVLVGVKIDVGDPLPDKPDEGALITGADLLPMASPDFEPGPPTPEAIQFARVVDRGIRAAEVIDTDALFIEKGKVWSVYVDIYALNYDGNLSDAGTLAATAALLTTKMPKYENEQVIREGNLAKLKTNGIATSCTFAKTAGRILLDPNGREESVMTASMTIANDEKYIRAMQKGLRGSLVTAEIEGMIDETFEKSKRLRELLKKAVGE
jgi:exosome complex component RRP42